MTKLAKLPDIQTACLAHNAGWTLVMLIDKQLYTIGRLYHDKTDQCYYLEDHKIVEAKTYYLHPKHNEELEPKIDDFVYGSFLEHNSTYEEDLKEFLNTTSHAICFNNQSDPVSLVHFKELGYAEPQIYYLKTCYRIIYRENVAYFPQFEWVTYNGN